MHIHISKKFLVMPARIQDLGALPYGIFTAIAGDFSKGAVDLLDDFVGAWPGGVAYAAAVGHALKGSAFDVLHWSSARFEYGWTHAYAGLADWLQLRDEHGTDAERQLACLLEGVAHIADDVLRSPEYAFTTRQADWDASAFVAAIEAQDEDGAVALLRGAIAINLGFAEVEPALTRAALAHYSGFGHSLIYVTKAAVLIAKLGEQVLAAVVLPLIRNLVYATREDLIPEFRGYTLALAQWDASTPGADAPQAVEWRKLGIDKSLQAVLRHASSDVTSLYRALLGANAVSMLAFDMAREERVQVPVSANIGWLDFTHGITFANAVRKQCTKFPALWPQGLLQMALFKGRNAAFTVTTLDSERWRVSVAHTFIAEQVARLFDHGQGEFIVLVHQLKTTLAVREEIGAGVPVAIADALCAALNRFLHSPLKRRRVQRSAHQAISFVEHE